MWTISLPVGVQLSTNKWFPLNLNHYRNAHFRDLNKAKVLFHDRVSPLVKGLPKLERIAIGYTLYTRDKRRVDVNNIISIVDKFFSDVLVEAGKLEDDHCRILPMTASRYGGIDIDHPRVDATIQSIGPEADIVFA